MAAKSPKKDSIQPEFGMFEAKTHLSELIQRVLEGESFYITKRGKRVAELRPVESSEQPLSRGCAANSDFWMADDFDAPLDDFDDYQ